VYRGQPCELEYSKYRQARTYQERVDDANHVTVAGVFDEVLVDWLEPSNSTGENPVWCSWGPAPNPGWLLSQSGEVKLAQPWFDGDAMGDCLADPTSCAGPSPPSPSPSAGCAPAETQLCGDDKCGGDTCMACAEANLQALKDAGCKQDEVKAYCCADLYA
jgi:hypothetical protein